MKTSRFQQEFRSNASKLHKKIGDALRSPTSPFAGFKIYQEYPVSRVNVSYRNNAHKFDWVILDLKIVIEAHGEQHYKPVQFGGISIDEAISNFKLQQNRDKIKQAAAEETGYTCISIPYSDLKLINTDYIWNLYQKNKIIEQIQEPPKEINEYKEAQKERAKEYRKEQYEKQKEWKAQQKLLQEE